MDRVKGCFGATLTNLLNLAVNPGFYLKAIALCLTITTSLFWRIPDAGNSGMDGHFEEVIFAHTVPGYLTVMFGLVLIYILGDRPNKWFYYVFYGTGIALLLLVGCFGVYNCLFGNFDWGSPPLFMAFSNLLTAGVIALDLFWSTALFGLCKRVRKSLDHGGEKSDHEDSDKGLDHGGGGKRVNEDKGKGLDHGGGEKRGNEDKGKGLDHGGEEKGNHEDN